MARYSLLWLCNFQSLIINDDEQKSKYLYAMQAALGRGA
jgi:hypothetical protein